MTRNVDEKNLENVAGGVENPDGRIEDREDKHDPEADLPIAAPVQGEVQNETEGGGNTTFGR